MKALVKAVVVNASLPLRLTGVLLQGPPERGRATVNVQDLRGLAIEFSEVLTGALS